MSGILEPIAWFAIGYSTVIVSIVVLVQIGPRILDAIEAKIDKRRQRKEEAKWLLNSKSLSNLTVR